MADQLKAFDSGHLIRRAALAPQHFLANEGLLGNAVGAPYYKVSTNIQPATSYTAASLTTTR